MDSVMKGQMGAMPPPEFLGQNRPGPSVRPSSVRLSVCDVDVCWALQVTVRRIISLGSSLLGAITVATQSKGNTPKIRVEQEWGRSLRKPAISLKRGKVTINYQYMKSHTRFRLVPKSTTLDDFEGPLRGRVSKRASFVAHHENLNEDRELCLQTTLSVTTMQHNDSRF